MSLRKQQRRSQSLHQEAVEELQGVLKAIERIEDLIESLQMEMAAVTQNYPAQRTTREDVDFLTDLLACAKKRLLWENQMEALRDRVPNVLEKVAHTINDPKGAPTTEMATGLLTMMQAVKASMERLEAAMRG
jgi:hypothetical protein